MEVSGHLHSLGTLPAGERATLYPLVKWLGGSQSKSGHCGKENKSHHCPCQELSSP